MFSLYFLDTYINMVKYLQRVPLNDLFRNVKDEIMLEISKATICRHIKNKDKPLF